MHPRTPVLLLVLLLAGCNPQPVEQDAPRLLFGRSGLGPGEFNYPRATALGPDGLLYVVDKAARIQVFQPDGTYVREWKMPADDAGRPTGLGIAPDGRVFAADTHYSRVVVFSPEGTLLELFGSYGDGPGRFRLPTDVAIAPDGTIYVSEYGGNDRITVYDSDWRFLRQIGGPGTETTFQRPQAVFVGPDGTLWVADSCNHRICAFDPDGTLRGTFGQPGGQAGDLRFPYNVEVLPDGTLVVCEFGNNRVQRLARDGRSLGVWGGPGRDPGRLAYPWALTVVDDRVFIVDSGNCRVQAIEIRQLGVPGKSPATRG